MSERVEPGDLIRIIPEYFEFIGGSSKKFWEIGWLSDRSWKTSWGRIGSKGQERTRTFHTTWEATSEYHSLVTKKMRKGYLRMIRPKDRPTNYAFSNDTHLVLRVHDTWVPRPVVCLTPDGTQKDASLHEVEIIEKNSSNSNKD